MSDVLGGKGFTGKIVTLNDRRHSLVTYVLAKGVHVKDVQAPVGLESATMTFGAYADSDPSERARAMRTVYKV